MGALFRNLIHPPYPLPQIPPTSSPRVGAPEQLNVRSRDVEEQAAQELRRLDLEIRSLQDERTRLLAKVVKKMKR
ncbi:hypothetical protein Y032_0083g1671 [Ancylostoma ceylanicum]|nr:hypothetical protein Y032_0083g1671 [Ancylostoma ceylanicum]